MKILYVAGSGFDQPRSGCSQRSYFLYKALSECGEVEVLNPQSWGEGSLMRRFFAVPFRKLTKVARLPFRRLPMRQYDAVVVRYLNNAAEMQAWRYGPCYVDLDDFPLQAYDLVESRRLPVFLRPLGRMLVKVWQRYCLSKCKGVWVSNKDDVKKIKVPNLKVAVLPNLAMPPKEGYRVDASQKRQLMTVGLMGYAPNAEGVAWFVREIWPKIHAHWPDLSYVIAGKGLPVAIREEIEGYPQVKYLGFVEDLDALYEESSAVVAPILSGAGTCIKVIEAGLHGRFVFGTPMAVRGQPSACMRQGTCVFNDADEFISGFEKFECIGDRNELQKEFQNSVGQENSFENFLCTVKKLLM